MADYEEGGRSIFNEAALKMQRIHRIQDDINRCKIHPLNYHPDFQKPNYEIIFSLLCSLEMEIIGKLNSDEVDEVDRLRKNIETIIKNKPPYVKKKYYDKYRTELNPDLWKQLEKIIFEYERKLRKLIDKHNIGSPSEEKEGGWD